MRGDRDDDETPREAREGWFRWVTVKEGADGKIRASHNTNTPPFDGRRSKPRLMALKILFLSTELPDLQVRDPHDVLGA